MFLRSSNQNLKTLESNLSHTYYYRNQSFAEKNHIKNHVPSLQSACGVQGLSSARVTQDPVLISKNFLPHVVVQLEQKKKTSSQSSMATQIQKELMTRAQINHSKKSYVLQPTGSSSSNLARCTSSRNLKYSETSAPISAAGIAAQKQALDKKMLQIDKELRSVSSQKELKSTFVMDHTSPMVNENFALSQIIGNDPIHIEPLEEMKVDVTTQLRDNYQRHIPNRMKRSMVQRPQTQNIRRATINTTH